MLRRFRKKRCQIIDTIISILVSIREYAAFSYCVTLGCPLLPSLLRRSTTDLANYDRTVRIRRSLGRRDIVFPVNVRRADQLNSIAFGSEIGANVFETVYVLFRHYVTKYEHGYVTRM